MHPHTIFYLRIFLYPISFYSMILKIFRHFEIDQRKRCSKSWSPPNLPACRLMWGNTVNRSGHNVYEVFQITTVISHSHKDHPTVEAVLLWHHQQPCLQPGPCSKQLSPFFFSLEGAPKRGAIRFWPQTTMWLSTQEQDFYQENIFKPIPWMMPKSIWRLCWKIT